MNTECIVGNVHRELYNTRNHLGYDDISVLGEISNKTKQGDDQVLLTATYPLTESRLLGRAAAAQA